MLMWILSMALYLCTMGYVLYIDREPKLHIKKRKYIIIWLYIFLCFGYMTGSDWRNYEPLYYDSFLIDKYLNEPLSWLYFKYVPIIIKDYWLSLGICKCIHLFILIKLLKEINERWLSILVLLFPYQVCFMFIQNPFRFMMALGLVYIAIILYLREFNATGITRSKTTLIKMVGLIILAATFHNSCILLLLMLPTFAFIDKIQNVDKVWLFVSYLIIVILTSNVDFLNAIKNGVNGMLMGAMTIKDYSETYSVDDNSQLLSIGNILKIVFFVFIIVSRENVTRNDPKALLVYGFAITYCFADRFLLLIPTGFRLVIPFMNFYVAYIIAMLYTERRLGRVILIYSFLMFSKTLWTAYDLIPYSNSIPYILTGHKDYYERHLNNVVEYKERTGNELILRIDQ